MIDTEFVVYGRDMDEIETRAKMIARKFFVSREPSLTYDVTKIGMLTFEDDGKINLWRAEVHASWEPDAWRS